MIDYKNIPKLSGIYKFTNKLKNKVYIGQAVNLRSRVRDHLKDYKKDKKNSHLYNSIKKHGIENFQLEILIEGKFTKNELDQMEIRFIELFKSNNSIFGYNLTAGGGGTSGLKQSLEVIKKRIESRKWYKHSEESKQKMSNSAKGFKHSEEQIKKIIESRKGYKHSQETKDKISKGNTNKKPSQETKDKISKAKKGKSKSKEDIQKRTETRKQNGFKHTQETIQKMKNRITSEETKDKISKANSGKKHSLQRIEKVIKAKKLNRARKLIQEICCYEEYFYSDFVYKS